MLWRTKSLIPEEKGTWFLWVPRREEKNPVSHAVFPPGSRLIQSIVRHWAHNYLCLGLDDPSRAEKSCIFTCSHPVCKNLSGGSASPNAQHSVRSTHEAAGSAHAFASSRAVETEVKWEICHPSQKAGLEWSVPWAFWVLYKRTGVGEAVSIRGENQERRWCHLGKTAYGSSIRVMLSGPATLCHLLPLHPRSICQIPQDVSKRFWIIDEPKEDAFRNIKYKNRPVQLVQIVGHWQFPF